MENQSDRSSETSSLQGISRAPSIHVDSFFMQEHVQGIANSQDPKIYTVAQTLKDPFILSHIKPDYGSLGDFMVDVDVSLRKDYLTQKKRKNQGAEEENGEKKMRAQLKDKTQTQLHQIFLNPQSSALEKKIASKLMVENIFKETFNVSIQTFESQNIKQQNARNVKINLNDIDQIFRERKKNVERQSVTSFKKSKLQRKSGNENLSMKVEKDKKIQPIPQYQKYEFLNGLKKSFLSFKGVNMEQCLKLMERLESQKNNEDDQSSRSSKGSKNRSKSVFQIKKQMLVIQNLDLTPQIMFGILTKYPFQITYGFSLNQVRAKEEYLIFLLQAFSRCGNHLINIEIKRISMENMDNLISKLRDILITCPVKELHLQFLGLDSKHFCELALGIAKNQTLQIISLSHNEIDRTACRSLELIARHCTKIQKICLKNNYIEKHNISHLTAEHRKKIEL